MRSVPYQTLSPHRGVCVTNIYLLVKLSGALFIQDKTDIMELSFASVLVFHYERYLSNQYSVLYTLVIHVQYTKP